MSVRGGIFKSICTMLGVNGADCDEKTPYDYALGHLSKQFAERFDTHLRLEPVFEFEPAQANKGGFRLIITDPKTLNDVACFKGYAAIQLEGDSLIDLNFRLEHNGQCYGLQGRAQRNQLINAIGKALDLPLRKNHPGAHMATRHAATSALDPRPEAFA